MLVDLYRFVRPLRYVAPVKEHIRFREGYDFETAGGPLLVADPTLLADVYNSDDELARYVRENGVVIDDFGGDTGCAVVWQPPHLILDPIFTRDREETPEAEDLPPDARRFPKEVWCDSAAFVFLPLAPDTPPPLREKAAAESEAGSGITLDLPAGRWSVWYEDWQDSHGLWRRRIVARWQPPEATRPAQFTLPL